MLGAVLALSISGVACAGSEETGDLEGIAEGAEDNTGVTTEALGSSARPAVGLAIEIDDGIGKALTLRAGQRFWINQIDFDVVLDGIAVDEGVSALDRTGDFAKLNWSGTEFKETSFSGQNQDGTFTRRRFYRDAKWMEKASQVIIWQVDARGRILDLPSIVNFGKDDQGKPWDDFFVRRLHAIQWTHDCPADQDCTGASNYSEEGLLEARDSRHPERTFALNSKTTAFKVFWTAQTDHSYTIPVTQVAAPTFAYGFKLDVDTLTPPRSDKTYAPGTTIEFRLSMKDGEGKRLYPEGTLPTYNDVLFGTATQETGITYWTGLTETALVYYRRKHKERMVMTQFIGPAQDIQPLRTYTELEDFLAAPNVETSTVAEDGVWSNARTFPPLNELVVGAWNVPQSDKFSFTLPADAKPGTYYLTTKARRVYLGEDVAVTSQVKLQVGTKTVTTAKLPVGNCSSCHNNGGELTKVNHGNSDLATCNSCHVPLFSEPENEVYSRVHFIHSRSDRVDTSVSKCAICHTSKETIQRTSKSACLSCHQSYPASHVAAFGPVTNNYIGGGRESFQQCTSSCHTTHPNSQLR